jgi:hypothetical protein
MGTSYDQGMDVYVVIDQDTDAPGVVIGAAVSLDAAWEIADRSDAWPEADYRPKWLVDLDTGVHSRRWAGVWQEIVRTPLAGNVRRIPEPLIDSVDPLRAIAPVVAGQPVRYGEEVQEIGRTWGAP